MTISAFLATLRRATRQDKPRISISMTVFRDNGDVPVRIMV